MIHSRITGRRLTALAMLGSVVLTAGCSANSTSASSETTQIASDSTVTATPQAEASSSVPEKTTVPGPTIDQEHYEKGVVEGNIYVIYAGVMCFGGTLGTLEEAQSASTASPQQVADEYALIPQEVRDQSDYNKTHYMAEAPQACYDSGWVNPGPV